MPAQIKIGLHLTETHHIVSVEIIGLGPERGVWALPVDAPQAEAAVTGVGAFLTDHWKVAIAAWEHGWVHSPGTPWVVKRGATAPTGPKAES